MQDITIAGIQSKLHWEDIDANLTMFSEKIDSINENVDLIILPETFSTGFSMNTSNAETMEGKSVSWLKTYAKKKQCCIAGSIIIKEGNNYYNRMVIAKENGVIETYDKRHLFTFGEEDKHFSAGNKKIVFELKGWKICPLICYDLRFPVWSRNKEEIDLYFYVANWPEVRSKAWTILLQARAIENASYVAGINRIGKDFSSQNHTGNSAFIDFRGDEIFNFPLNKDHIEITILSKQKLDRFRTKFPVLKDGDDFEIKH